MHSVAATAKARPTGDGHAFVSKSLAVSHPLSLLLFLFSEKRIDMLKNMFPIKWV